MEGKNKFNTYVVSFDYPSSYSSVFLRLRSLMYDMNFSSIVADEYGIPRQLNENSFAITTSLAASEIEDLIRLKCLDLPGNDSKLRSGVSELQLPCFTAVRAEIALMSGGAFAVTHHPVSS